jgi:hypothetical protein
MSWLAQTEFANVARSRRRFCDSMKLHISNRTTLDAFQMVVPMIHAGWLDYVRIVIGAYTTVRMAPSRM